MALTITPTNDVLNALRHATRGTEWDNRLFLVGGFVRDKLLHSGGSDPVLSDDIDLVLEGDVFAVAEFLWKSRVADYRPVEYGQFGTTQVQVRAALKWSLFRHVRKRTGKGRASLL